MALGVGVRRRRLAVVVVHIMMAPSPCRIVGRGFGVVVFVLM